MEDKEKMAKLWRETLSVESDLNAYGRSFCDCLINAEFSYGFSPSWTWEFQGCRLDSVFFWLPNDCYVAKNELDSVALRNSVPQVQNRPTPFLRWIQV